MHFCIYFSQANSLSLKFTSLTHLLLTLLVNMGKLHSYVRSQGSVHAYSLYLYASLVRYAFVCDFTGHQPITDERTFVSQSQSRAERDRWDAAS